MLAEGLEKSRPTGDGLARLCRLLCAPSRRAQPSEASRWWPVHPRSGEFTSPRGGVKAPLQSNWPATVFSLDQVWRHDADKLARSDHLGFLPEFWKVPRVPGHQVVGAGGISAFQKSVVVGVLCHLQRSRRDDAMRPARDELEKLPPETLANLKLGAASTS